MPRMPVRVAYRSLGEHLRLVLVLLVAVGAAGAPLLSQRDFEVPTRAPVDAPKVAQMVDEQELGERLVVRGQVLSASGAPVEGASVFAYQTDAQGIYSDVGNRRPRLRGYARTDASGRFELRTIRPASYPDSRVQQHIHFHLAPRNDGASETVGEIVFDDDPLLGDRMRRDPANAVCEPRQEGGSLVCAVTLRLRH